MKLWPLSPAPVYHISAKDLGIPGQSHWFSHIWTPVGCGCISDGILSNHIRVLCIPLVSLTTSLHSRGAAPVLTPVDQFFLDFFFTTEKWRGLGLYIKRVWLRTVGNMENSKDRSPEGKGIKLERGKRVSWFGSLRKIKRKMYMAKNGVHNGAFIEESHTYHWSADAGEFIAYSFKVFDQILVHRTFFITIPWSMDQQKLFYAR